MSLVAKSIDIIKSLQRDEGKIFATRENDAYPYIYPRDAVIMTKALNAKGLYERSEKFYCFLKIVVRNGEVFQRYNKEGMPFVSNKGEYDNIGLVLHGIYDTFSKGGNQKFLDEIFPLVDSCVQFIIKKIGKNGLVAAERSIHEFYRLENGYEIWANSATCRGLLDASEIAGALDKKDKARKWKKHGENLKQEIEDILFSQRRGMFIKTITRSGVRITNPDISQLSPFYFGLFDSKEVLARTLRNLRKTIWDKELGGFKRFRRFDICKDWHWYTGGDGPWFLTMWAAMFYNKLKNKKRLEECMGWINRVITPSGLLPEHIALEREYLEWKKNEIEFSERIMNGIKRAESFKTPIEGVIYWAVPHGWAQAEYILLQESL